MEYFKLLSYQDLVNMNPDDEIAIQNEDDSISKTIVSELLEKFEEEDIQERMISLWSDYLEEIEKTEA